MDALIRCCRVVPVMLVVVLVRRERRSDNESCMNNSIQSISEVESWVVTLYQPTLPMRPTFIPPFLAFLHSHEPVDIHVPRRLFVT